MLNIKKLAAVFAVFVMMSPIPGQTKGWISLGKMPRTITHSIRNKMLSFDESASRGRQYVYRPKYPTVKLTKSAIISGALNYQTLIYGTNP
jgi:hypothetical protein